MGSLTVHLLNDNGDPVCGKQVFVNFSGSFLGVADTNLAGYTDNDGIVEFGDIPTGEVEVYVDGDLQVAVNVGQNDAEDVTISI